MNKKKVIISLLICIVATCSIFFSYAGELITQQPSFESLFTDENEKELEDKGEENRSNLMLKEKIEENQDSIIEEKVTATNEDLNEDGEPAWWPPKEEERRTGRFKARYVDPGSVSEEDDKDLSLYSTVEKIKLKCITNPRKYFCSHTFYDEVMTTWSGYSTSMMRTQQYGRIFCTEGGYGIWQDSGPEIVVSSLSDWNTDGGWWNTVSYNTTRYTYANTIENKIYRIAVDYYGQSNVENNYYESAFTQMAIWNKLPVAWNHAEGYYGGRYLTKFDSDSTVLREYNNFLTNVVDPQLKLWNTKPSFSGSTVNLNVGEKKTITDSTGALKYYESFTYTQDGVTISHTKGNNYMTAVASTSAGETVSMSETTLKNAGASKYPDKYSGQYVILTSAQRAQNTVHCNGRVDPIGMSINFEVAVNGYAKVKKVPSSDKHLVALCPEQYSLEGATYAIYTSNSDAEADTNRVTTLTTNKDGYFPTTKLNAYTNNGTYYIKEISEPKGFVLNPKIYQFKINVNQTTNVTVDEKPYFDPMTLILEKQIPNGHPEFQKYLEGAEYTVRYYPNMYSTEAELKGKTPLKTWVFRTDSNGRIKFADRWRIRGDELFKNTKDTVVGLIGTYTFEETKAPDGFLKNDGLEIRQIQKGVKPPDINATNAPVFSELPDPNMIHKITVTKKIKESDVYKPFGNPTAIFEVKGKNIYGETFTLRKSVVLDKNTLKNGYYTASVVFDNLESGEYTVKEVKTARYAIKNITNVSSNGSVSGETVKFELVNTAEGKVTYENEVSKWNSLSHFTSVVNKL